MTSCPDVIYNTTMQLPDMITVADQPVYLVFHPRRRKHVSLVHRQGQWQLRFPQSMRAQALAWIKQHQDWLQQHLCQTEKQLKRRFLPDEKLPFRGQLYPVKLDPGKPPHLELKNQIWQVSLPANLPTKFQSQLIKNLFQDWYLLQARQLLIPQVHQQAEKMNLPKPWVKLKLMHSRWGSCNHQSKKIHLDWRLVMAPPEIAQYVIVHEVCHLIHPHHQPSFWRLVRQHFPGYRSARLWLKTKSAMLQWN